MMRPLIRFLNGRKLRALNQEGPEEQQARLMALVRELRASPIALCTDEANRQHYGLPPEFFQRVLGPHLKYSGCVWGPGVTSLARAEEDTLDLYCQRAQLEDGQEVLDLGCGWGSLSLYLARRYPRSRILAVSNSAQQRQFLEAQGLPNLRVLTCDVNRLELPGGHFDRILSVEMFEHVRNYERLFATLHGALRDGGKLFVHIFCHRWHAYPFDQGWLERNFFAGGLMPSQHLLLHFSQPLHLEEHWLVEGRHYQRTAEAWLQNMRAAKGELGPILRQHYGSRFQAWRWWRYWQIFFLACAELFGHDGGRQWMVTHLRWRKGAHAPGAAAGPPVDRPGVGGVDGPSRPGV